MYAVKKGCFFTLIEFTVSVILSGGNCLLSNKKDCSRKGDVTFVSLLPPVVKTCFNSNVNHTFVKFSFLFCQVRRITMGWLYLTVFLLKV